MRRMIQFSLFNIPIRVLPWFWVTMAFIGGVLYADTKEALFELLLFMLAGFISILVHELGHALSLHGEHATLKLLHSRCRYREPAHARERSIACCQRASLSRRSISLSSGTKVLFTDVTQSPLIGSSDEKS